MWKQRFERSYWCRWHPDPQSDQDYKTYILISHRGTYFHNTHVGGWSYVDSFPKDPLKLNRAGAKFQTVLQKEFLELPYASRVLFMDRYLPKRFIYWYVNKKLSKEIHTDPARQIGDEDIYRQG